MSNATVDADVYVEEGGASCFLRIDVTDALCEAYCLDPDERREVAKAVRECIEDEAWHILPACRLDHWGDYLEIFGGRFEVVVCINGLEATLPSYEARRIAEALEGGE